MVQCVYKISCVDENIKEFYIGSTDDLRCRTNHHKHYYNTKHNYKVYNFIRENGGLSNWEINPIEIFSFLTEEELRQHEQFYMDEYKPQLNCKRAIGLTQTEYYEENKETIKERVKNYSLQNKEKIAEYKKTTKFKQLKAVSDKKYREKNKEKIAKKEKEYREKNKKIMLLKKKEYREKNKAKINAKQNEKINCPQCNKEMLSTSIYRHIKTQHPNP